MKKENTPVSVAQRVAVMLPHPRDWLSEWCVTYKTVQCEDFFPPSSLSCDTTLANAVGGRPKSLVTEETSGILSNLGYMCSCRGIINVKGKGELKTYFVHTEMTRSLSQGTVMP
ncbi:hypothetical protein CRENBAI_008383 [Crenichthys baileyi]|uniref:Guanylate cyclase domain-containing protein n=1 Tax=Crenichthys baileyi TaxID=28760 RepID=A0AAV9SJA3_9TELE